MQNEDETQDTLPGLSICGAAEAARIIGLSKPIALALWRAGYLSAQMCDGRPVFHQEQATAFAAGATFAKPEVVKRARRARKSKGSSTEAGE